MRSSMLTTILAAVVAVLLAGCGGGGPAGSSGAADGGAQAAVELTATDLAYDSTEVSAEAGSVTVALENDGEAVHNVVIEEAGDQTVVEAAGGSTATGSVSLEAGTYTFYCSIPGHRDAGMEGILTVE